MEGDDSELLAAEGGTTPAADVSSVVLDLRRVIYRCDLLEHGEFSDGDRQALWEAVVVAYYGCFVSGVLTVEHLRRLGRIHLETHEHLAAERARHEIGDATVIPDGICTFDVEAGALAPPYVDPVAASALADALIAELS